MDCLEWRCSKTIMVKAWWATTNNIESWIASKKIKLSVWWDSKGVVLSSHTYLATRQNLLRLCWELMLYPPYSPDLALSDYYLFRFLQNSLNGKTFNNDEAVKSHLVQFFSDKNQKFYDKRSINKIENISSIKVHSLYLKNVLNLYEKTSNYFWDNSI